MTTTTTSIDPRKLTTPEYNIAWAASGASTVLASEPQSSSSPSPTYQPADTSSYTSAVGQGTTYTTFSSITITQSSTTFTSFGQVLVTTPLSSLSTSASAAFSSATSVGQIESVTRPVCIGDGLDVSADGLIAAAVLPSAVGLLLWVCHVQFI